LKNNRNAFIWTLGSPAYVISISYLYWILILIPLGVIDEGKIVVKEIKELWREGKGVVALLAFSVLMGFVLSYGIDKSAEGLSRILEILLFLGGVFFWCGVLVIVTECSVDLWGWIKRKMDW
jgi:hypothetical protein